MLRPFLYPQHFTRRSQANENDIGVRLAKSLKDHVPIGPIPVGAEHDNSCMLCLKSLAGVFREPGWATDECEPCCTAKLIRGPSEYVPAEVGGGSSLQMASTSESTQGDDAATVRINELGLIHLPDELAVGPVIQTTDMERIGAHRPLRRLVCD
jgi:hypothetical protein